MPRPALRGWPRAALGLAVAFGAVAGAALAAGLDPHMDPRLLPAGCASCHRGHGAPSSPMLEGPQKLLCLRCHGTRGAAGREILAGNLAPDADPTLLGGVLSLPTVHPVSDSAFSRRQAGEVVCTSCHAPHRSMPEPRSGGAPAGRRKLSPGDPNRFEFELCQDCHGAGGTGTLSLFDVSRLTNPNNRSYHPVEAPAQERSPSASSGLSGQEINCTDCHGNSDPSGPRGPHGSAVPFLLAAAHSTVDGVPESAASHALCYSCHDRETVLSGSAFPYHRQHVVGERTSCATCHNAHGSVRNRALIRFGEETVIAGVGPSLVAGRLAFLSETAGSGTCYLTCHGHDHAPLSYGSPGLTFDDSLPVRQGRPQELPSSGGRPRRPDPPTAPDRKPPPEIQR